MYLKHNAKFSKTIVFDGEGAKIIEISVKKLRQFFSQNCFFHCQFLVKTAIAGEDANWEE